MFLFRLFFYLFAGLLLSGCAVEAISLDARKTAPYSNQPMETAQREEDELRYLIEMSDLIVVGKMVQARRLVDPEKMREEFENIVQKKINSNPQRYIKGNVYTIAVSKTIYERRIISPSENVFVYSLGDFYSLHTRLIWFLPEREYLIFLSRATEKDISKEFKVSDLKDVSRVKQVSRNNLFLVTGESSGLRQTKDNDKLVRRVEKLVDELKYK